MDRVREPELMDDPVQAAAYARADFADVNQSFVDRIVADFPELGRGRRPLVADVGCGPADIPARLLRAFPRMRIMALDGSAAMLREAQRALASAEQRRAIDLVRARVQELPLADGSVDGVLSNSLLHHLATPRVFWSEARRVGRRGAPIVVMDLHRPESVAAAERIVNAAAEDEDPILRRDFLRSLLAAFTIEEVRMQLRDGLERLTCERSGERHWIVSGRLP